jgi:hypothetical protein
METNKNFWSYLTQLFLEWEMAYIKFAEKIKKNMLIIFPKSVSFMR